MNLEGLDQTAGTDSAGVYMQVLFSTVPEALQAFDTGSGEIYASLLAGSLDEGMTRAGRLVARSNQSFVEGWGLWVNANGRTASTDGDGNAADVSADGFGFDTGIDYRGPDNGWALGATFGYLKGNLNVEARRSTANYDGWHVGGYGRFGTGGAGFTGTAALNYTNSDANVRRTIEVNNITRTAQGFAGVNVFAISGELRYGLGAAKGSRAGWALGPIVSVQHAKADLGQVREAGANSLDISSAGGSDSMTRYGGGVFGNWQGAQGGFDISAQYVGGSANIAQIGVSLAGAPGITSAVRSARTSGSAGLFTIAGEYSLGSGWSIGGNVRALLGKDEKSAQGNVTVGWAF